MPLLNNYQPFPQTFRATKEQAPPPLLHYAGMKYNNLSMCLNSKGIRFSGEMEKCNAETLAHIESRHQYLEEDSGELWQRFVTKKYPGEEPEDGDSWKELYSFLEKEREKKLKQLSQRIGKHHQ
ncbi:hypothetical protein COOONC_25760, partial [Cooperia oncophora]